MSVLAVQGRPAAAPRWRMVLRWVLVAVSLAFLLRLGFNGREEIRRAATVLATQQAHLLVLVLLLEVAWSLSLSQLLRSSLLSVGGSVTRRAALRISLASFTLSRVIPGGGAAGGVFATRELIALGNPPAVALTAMALSWGVATLTLAALVSGGMLAAAATADLPLTSLLPAAGAQVVVITLGLVLIRALGSPPLRERIADRLARLLRRLGRDEGTAVAITASLERVACNLRHPTRVARAASWSVTAWLTDAAALWLMFSALGHPLGLRELVVGYASANLLNSLPELTPGWIGVFEAALTATYVALGVPAGVATAAVLSYRLVSFWLPVAAGVLPAVTSLAVHRQPHGALEEEIAA